MPIVVKGCSARYAIEECGTIRLSKPEKFRFEDSSLIGDISEGVTQRRRVTQTRDNDPADMERAAQLDEERNRAASPDRSRELVSGSGLCFFV